jgi:hypothetical protein
VDATITSTAASELFTQDLEEIVEEAHVITEPKTANPEDAKYTNAQDAETIPLSEAPKSVQASVKGEAPKADTKKKEPTKQGGKFAEMIQLVNDGHLWKGVVYKNPLRIFINNVQFNVTEQEAEDFARLYKQHEETKQPIEWEEPKDSDLPF